MGDSEPDIIHIAGPEIQIGTQLRQRCSWCGAVLIDVNLSRVAVPAGMNPNPPTWSVGGLVAVYGYASWEVEHKDGDQLPAKACGQLPFEVTGMEG